MATCLMSSGDRLCFRAAGIELGEPERLSGVRTTSVLQKAKAGGVPLIRGAFPSEHKLARLAAAQSVDLADDGLSVVKVGLPRRELRRAVRERQITEVIFFSEQSGFQLCEVKPRVRIGLKGVLGRRR